MGVFSFIPGLRRAIADPDLAIDLGTANTRLYATGRGLIADEPSVVSVRTATGSVAAVGARAASMATETGAKAVSPLRAGVIEDVDAATSLLAHLFRRARRLGVLRPRLLACAPTDACDEERAALVEASRRAGASAVKIVPEPMAAAIGAGLDVSSPYAQMIVDLGDGVTDIAVISSGSVIASSAVRTACSDMHAAVRRMVDDRHGTLLPLREAERLTCSVGVVPPAERDRPLVAVGRDRKTGDPRRISIDGREVVDAIDPIASIIVRSIRGAVAALPATTACEVIESGICLTGGGARLPGLADLIATETVLDVRPAADPLRSVINGAQQMLAVGAATGFWVS